MLCITCLKSHVWKKIAKLLVLDNNDYKGWIRYKYSVAVTEVNTKAGIQPWCKLKPQTYNQQRQELSFNPLPHTDTVCHIL